VSRIAGTAAPSNGTQTQHISVAELLEVPTLNLSVLAGAAGLDRRLTWAHVFEMPDPTGWLNGGELVMSTGMAISDEPSEQVEYLERLHAADAGAFLFGDTIWAKELSHAAREAADRLAFPVLWAAHEVAYIAIARVVVERSGTAEYARLQRLQRAYEIVRGVAFRGSAPTVLLRELSRLVKCDLFVLELPYGNTLFSDRAPDPKLRAALLEEAAAQPRFPAVVRLQVDETSALALPIEGSHRAALVVESKRVKPDVALLQHIATIVAVELEKLYGERERQRRLGAELLGKLIDQTIEGAAADQLLATHALADEPRVLVAWRTSAESDDDGVLHHRLAARGLHHLLARRDLHYGLLCGDDETVAALCEELVSAGAVGISGPLGRATRAPDAAREARIALKTATVERRTSARYGEGNDSSPFVPGSVSEAEALVEGVLGKLRDYDAEHNMDLLPSLRVFLRNNRKWQQTAVELHVHKQTVHYRMRRVEELTGRRLDMISDIAVIWYALEAEALLAAENWAAV